MYLKRCLTLCVPLCTLGILLFPIAPLLAQQDSRAVVLDSTFLAAYRWRNLGSRWRCQACLAAPLFWGHLSPASRLRPQTVF